MDNIDLGDSNFDAAMIFNRFISKVGFMIDRPVYVMIDEYDQFANELLGFNRDVFLNIIQKNGFVRKFYEVLKNAVADSTVGRIFITGVTTILVERFEIGESFDSASFASLLFYMGLLTMTGNSFGSEVSLKIPNETVKQLYVKLFLKVMKDTYKFNVDGKKICRIFKQMAVQGKNDSFYSI